MLRQRGTDFRSRRIPIVLRRANWPPDEWWLQAAPFGLGGAAGSSGSMICQSASETRGDDIPP